jgi:hypothetical protein
VLPGAENSLFTQHLLAGLRGGAPGPGGVIRIFDLYDYVQPRVTGDQSNQHPIFKAEIEENFPVALYLGGKAATPIPTTFPADEYEYDVFVSYHKKDKKWIRNKKPDKTWDLETLVPRLEHEGLRVFGDWCPEWRIGPPWSFNAESAVKNSRYTLAVLSPDYLSSNWSEHETLLAEWLGLESSQYRLLPIMREECVPRLSIRMRSMLDMTDDDEFEMNIARLVYQIRQPPDK